MKRSCVSSTCIFYGNEDDVPGNISPTLFYITIHEDLIEA